MNSHSISQTEETKQCKSCGKTKSISCFYSFASRSDEHGQTRLLRNKCKVCSNIRKNRPASRRKKRKECPDGIAHCTLCKQDKSIDSFDKSTSSPNGLHSHCKKCRSEYGKNRPFPMRRRQNIKGKYGISTEDYRSMHDAQGGCCAICGQKGNVIIDGIDDSLRIDHDHSTGVVRGLLCHQCNHGLGNFKDSPENLSNAIDYLMGFNR